MLPDAPLSRASSLPQVIDGAFLNAKAPEP
jgi:hypothetical protein